MRNHKKREILISKTPYDKRIAVMENGELMELVVESKESQRVLGNIYKGVVQKVLPGLQAAFIDMGMDKAGFLHVDDVIDRNIQLRKDFGDEDDVKSEKEVKPTIDQLLDYYGVDSILLDSVVTWCLSLTLLIMSNLFTTKENQGLF